MIESIEAVDPVTVAIHLNRPDSSLLLILADRAGMMVSPAAADAGDVGTARSVPDPSPSSNGFRETTSRSPTTPTTGKTASRSSTRSRSASSAMPRPRSVLCRRATSTASSASAPPTRHVAWYQRRRGLALLAAHRRLLLQLLTAAVSTTSTCARHSRSPSTATCSTRSRSGQGTPASEIFPPGYWAADPTAPMRSPTTPTAPGAARRSRPRRRAEHQRSRSTPRARSARWSVPGNARRGRHRHDLRRQGSGVRRCCLLRGSELRRRLRQLGSRPDPTRRPAASTALRRTTTPASTPAPGWTRRSRRGRQPGPDRACRRLRRGHQAGPGGRCGCRSSTSRHQRAVDRVHRPRTEPVRQVDVSFVSLSS